MTDIQISDVWRQHLRQLMQGPEMMTDIKTLKIKFFTTKRRWKWWSWRYNV